MSIERDSPEPLILDPSGTHKSTIILLHGRGRKASVFAEEMDFLRKALPHTKLIFPWAPKLRATVYKKSITRQWFDDWHLSRSLQSTDVVHSRYDEGLQTSGLGETVVNLHSLIREEARRVGGAQNVVLGGFSQGAAASLVAALLWDEDQRLGGIVAMCAWLPYVSQMTALLQCCGGEVTPCSANGAEHDSDAFDPFERTFSLENEFDRGKDGVQQALEWLRETIDVPRKRNPDRHGDLGHTPILFCHGLNDEKVMPEQSQNARDFLYRLGLVSAQRETYPGVGHEICREMKADIAVFFLSALGGDTTKS